MSEFSFPLNLTISHRVSPIGISQVGISSGSELSFWKAVGPPMHGLADSGLCATGRMVAVV